MRTFSLLSVELNVVDVIVVLICLNALKSNEVLRILKYLKRT